MAIQALRAPLIEKLVPVPYPAARVALQVALGVALLAALAQVRFEIGAVPVTGQTLGVLLIGAAYGSALGGATIAAYLVAGGLGLSIFAGGGAGWSTFMGTTGGYLVGFLVAGAVVGALSQRGWDRSVLSAALAMLVGTAIIYLFGIAWLVRFAPDFGTALQWGLWPFLAGDLLKLGIAAALLPTAWRLLGHE